MYNKNETTVKTVSGIELLQIAFIILKLCKVISWSWLWVLAPTWITAIIVVIFIACVLWIFK